MFDPNRYPPDWKQISLAVRWRSGGQCEAGALAQTQILPTCLARNGEPHPITGSTVVLTVAHMCRCRDREGRKCGEPTHLAALCQRCHLCFDRADHIAHGRASRHSRKAVSDLFPDSR